MTAHEPLDRVAAASAAAADRDPAIVAAYRAGHSLSAIARTAGLTRQGIRKIIDRSSDMGLPSTHAHPAGAVDVLDILTGEEYDIRTAEIGAFNDQVTHYWVCLVCAGTPTGGIQYDVSQPAALESYAAHYRRHHD